MKTYHEIKAFVHRWTLMEPSIPTDSFYWGESKRILEDQQKQFPYFWVSDYRFFFDRQQNGNFINLIWELDISIKGNSQRDNVVNQEEQLSSTHELMLSFFSYLQDQNDKGVISFNPSRLQTFPEEVYEPEDNWGWSFQVQIGSPQDCMAGLNEASLYQVKVFGLAYSGSAGALSIDINSDRHTVTWDKSTEEKQTILERLKTVINDATSLSYVARTDGVYLYIQANSIGYGSLSYDLENGINTHNWTALFPS